MSASPFLSHHHTSLTPSLAFLNPTKIPFFSCNRSKPCVIITRYNPINSDSEIKPEFPEPVSAAPTAPWMNEPLLMKPNEILKFKRRKAKKDSTFGRNVEHPDVDLTRKVGGGRGRLAMNKIFKSIDKLKEEAAPKLEEESRKDFENRKFRFGPGELWGDGEVRNYAPEAYEEVKGFDIPLKEIENEGRVKRTRMPWERNERVVVGGGWVKEESVSGVGLSIDGELLERLRAEAAVMRKWVKVKKAGVTEAAVDEVRAGWRTNELVLIKFDIPLCRNMDRAREIVETKTGGVVVWRNKDFLAVYRGSRDLPSSKDDWKKHGISNNDQDSSSTKMNHRNATAVASLSSDEISLDESVHGRDGAWESLHMSSLYERESDRLLDGLGPRFVDWWMQKPLPVDADLLPEIIPGLKTPVRLSLSNTRPQLTDAELTYLRKLARPLPTHFVLGRNRKLQGLAAAILKLWEKCHIAKIAVKWGVQNTDNEQMAEELKSLTGGVLLLRNKYFIILYRGKDFVPSDVANLVAERETELTRFQFEEEAARIKASETFSTSYEHLPDSGIIGTLSEFHSIQSETSKLREMKTEDDVQVEIERERLTKELKDQQQKLFVLRKKIDKSARALQKLNRANEFSEQDVDPEIISEEERQCLREMALKSDSTLVLGRRGVYDGVIEGMHQHWKHREIIKVITMQKKDSQINYTAKRLESESGGTLVSIVKLKEGHAIIIYRGKNYKRPKMAPHNLLNKREALFRSLELQRIGSLKFFAKQREQTIRDLKCKLAELLEKKSKSS